MTLFFFAILTLVSLIDYDPVNLHTFPPSGDVPIFGRMGLHLARLFLCIFGISAWLLPIALFLGSYVMWKRGNSKESVAKVSPIFLFGLGLCLLGAIRENYLSDEGLSPMFSYNSHENGAGGMIGSWLYCGLNPDHLLSLSNGGFLRLWLGEVGSTIIGTIFLVLGLTLIISWRENQSSIFTGLFTSINRLVSHIRNFYILF